MVARGSSFEAAAGACPFVALELDRDRRSDRPDYRHRCYAEQVPAPRTVAHQERYCLSPNFSGCPIFQAWAVRAAARPVPIPGGVAASTRSTEPLPEAPPEAASQVAPSLAETSIPPLAPLPGVAPLPPVAADDFGVEEPPLPEPEAVPGQEPWPDSMGVPIIPETGALGVPSALGVRSGMGVPSGMAMPSATRPPDAHLDQGGPIQTDTTWSAAVSGAPATEEEQLSVFGAPPSPQQRQPVEPLAPPPTFASTLPDEPLVSDVPSAATNDPLPQASPGYDDRDEAPPVPAFLAGRSARQRPQTRADQVDRDDLVPSWELDGRYGAEPGPRQASGADRGGMGTTLTTIAVVIIIGLGILAVLIIPGVLGGGGSQPTRRPTNLPTAPRTAQVTTVAVLPSATAEPTPTQAQPTPEPTPEASPILYTIKRNDTLARIARRNGTTVEAILAANPQIPGADAIQVGQVIVLPPPIAAE